ncbi:MAG: hypothetical protein P9L92_03440 [Candidatus Electryonea clarkiae]|nr:hypothetical protein [Candidatus Electryonea clarkiae]MDP8285956.1 hypothetical protein [Candidatus Electryonea clarkiae]
MDDYIREEFLIDPFKTNWFTPASEILKSVKDTGYRVSGDRLCSMEISQTLQSLGLQREKKRIGQSNPIWGFHGIRRYF